MSISEAQIFKEVCENDFAFFCKQYLKVVEPETEFEWSWHHDVLCHYAERVYYGYYQNLDINIPPRMMKSMIMTVLFPCWIWTKRPSFKILCASGSADLAIKFNTKRRDLIRSEAYTKIWPIVIRDDKDKVNEFANYRGGFMKAVSALGRVVGEGADLLLSDDLLDAMKSFSKANRDAVNTWFSQAFYNRAQDKKKVMRININQRLHVNDPSGNIEKNHNFVKLVLPMRMTAKNESTCDFVDPRKEGEFLHPSRYGMAEMEDDLKALGNSGFSAQHQQSPKPIGGGLIKDEWIRYYTELPEKFDKKIITADLTFKGLDTSDYVSFMIWGKIENRKYLINVVRGKWTYKVTKDRFKDFCANNHAPIKYIEDKANGPAMISDFEGQITGLTAWPKKGSPYGKMDKVSRLKLCSVDFENGEVYLPKDLVITEQVVEELTSFTEKGSATGNDDLVDTVSMGLLELKQAQTFFSG